VKPLRPERGHSSKLQAQHKRCITWLVVWSGPAGFPLTSLLKASPHLYPKTTPPKVLQAQSPRVFWCNSLEAAAHKKQRLWPPLTSYGLSSPMQICTRRRWPSLMVVMRWYRSMSSSCTSWRRRSGSTPSTPKIILPAVMSPYIANGKGRCKQSGECESKVTCAFQHAAECAGDCRATNRMYTQQLLTLHWLGAGRKQLLILHQRSRAHLQRHAVPCKGHVLPP
jgi:hypothetical protein